jgi:ketosteroid isomerase-like protein
MKHLFAFVMVILVSSAAIAQMGAAKTNIAVVQEIIELEKKWSTDIQRQDPALMEKYLAKSYFLAVGTKGRPLQITPRQEWLDNLKIYKLESFNIEDIKVTVYGSTAVVLMLWSQKALVNGGRRDNQSYLTDIWVKQKNGWRVAERHSIRVEQPAAGPPKP